MGVLLTKRDTFFTKEEFQQLVYSSLQEENSKYPIQIPCPCIWKPQYKWSGNIKKNWNFLIIIIIKGKQIISAILNHITIGLPGLHDIYKKYL